MIIKKTNSKLSSIEILSYFASSLYGKNATDDVVWDIAKNCVSHLDFEDCVIYLFDENNEFLIQKAAYGPKNPINYEIFKPILIKKGKGIVGSVAQSGIAEIIYDTSKDARYIVDDKLRYSEITVPIVFQGKILGVIDSENAQKGFFNEKHLEILTAISNLAANKIYCSMMEERIRKQTFLEQSKLTINSTRGVQFIPLKDIIRCEADSNYTYFFMTNNRTICASKTMKEYENKLLENNFIRVHRSHVINPNYVSELYNEGALKMTDNSVVEISRRRKKEVENRLFLI
jgi:putative methionine-R-sulfoxide reductase with GAF domain